MGESNVLIQNIIADSDVAPLKETWEEIWNNNDFEELNSLKNHLQ